MNFYNNQNRLKFLLSIIGLAIVLVSLWYTNVLVNEVRVSERNNMELWAQTVVRKAQLVASTDSLFQKLKIEERKRAELLARAYQKIAKGDEKDLTFYLDIISDNTSIPVIQTNGKRKILGLGNIDINSDSIPYLRGALYREFTQYKPIVLEYLEDDKIYLYYKNSISYSKIQDIVDELNKSFLEEIVLNSASVPVIVTDSNKKLIIDFGNIPEKEIRDSIFAQDLMQEMQEDNMPIEISLPQSGRQYILYRNSPLQDQLRYFPLIVFLAIGIFLGLAYLIFSLSRRAEQNQVWAGLAKETAHQLGTPISSMIAWVDILRMQGSDSDSIDELEKDINRLETITNRFSKIGSIPKLNLTDVGMIVQEIVEYLRARTSKKVHYKVNVDPENGHSIVVPLNEDLFVWVIENLCKNAVDAMQGVGDISIEITEDSKKVYIEIEDTGKGIARDKFRSIFKPGYTTKKRGWGLGLSLADRIITHYHKGRIFVKSSAIDKGTVFAIELKKSLFLQP
ncbi:MAG: two-component sensor histidine kinase [Bacteroidetes bacterium 4572_77]|nr:MAG: two-component sensor histidine kinase [Bacteroidetes bacterium 4572_77]